MSKERAQRRAEREREAEARAAEAQRETQRETQRKARRDARTSLLTRWLPKRRARPTGVIADRHRTRTSLLVVSVIAINVLVWLASGDWAVRFLAIALSVLIAPVVLILMTS